ncbi:hypothetical protein HU200_026076 [Digitaria exilis]|uniref:Uncharacterized protein n=1 Tax=Digitaria exilis TaxID=1010633 RepID=A0A835BYP4_9POAL|nr:hypothetical protein HU200_026076 [Digitaria exilis]
MDEDNSRPYSTHTRRKRDRKTHTSTFLSSSAPSLTWSPSHSTSSFPKRSMSASLTHRSACRQVAVAGTNSRALSGALYWCKDIKAAWAVGRFLPKRAKEADVYTCTTRRGNRTGSRDRLGMWFSR